jgi:thiol-disulfide isomerase/thioredoxin
MNDRQPTDDRSPPRAFRTMLVIAAFAALTVATPARAQDVGLDIGATPAPVTLEDLDGNPVDLGQWLGTKPVVFEFWATWCPLCEALEPRLEAVKRQHGDDIEVVFIAVAVNQNQRRIKRHLEQHPLPGPVLWDTQGLATRAFQAPTTSYIVILDATGKVVYTGVGEDQEIGQAVAAMLR